LTLNRTLICAIAGQQWQRCVLAAAMLWVAVPAQAQIYSWQDANGNLVLSDKKPLSGVSQIKSFTVPKADSIRATRYASTDRGRLYDDVIAEHARRNNVRAELVRAVVQVESAFNPRAISRVGAMGLMQLMPATAREFGVLNAFDPVENIRGGVAYLRQLLDRYSNNEELALAAYNAGPGAVDKHNQTVPPYRETRNYVKQISRITQTTNLSNSDLARPIEARANQIYKVTEIIDGREVVRYTDRKPTDGSY
jgi:soluble lytic murein transglycosylase-like protein